MDLTLLLSGLFGGVIRGIVGYTKYSFSYKNVPFKATHFLLMVFMSGFVGLAAGWLVRGVVGTNELSDFYAFLAGYAGGDFIENAFKIIFKRPELFKLPDLGKAK